MITTADIAALAGVAVNTVHARAKARGIKPLMQIGRAHIWGAEEAKTLMLDIGRGFNAKKERVRLHIDAPAQVKRKAG